MTRAPVRYRDICDDNGHQYLIPVSRQDEWDAWMQIPSDDPASWEAPEFAVRIEGGVLSFTNPQIDGLPVVFPK